MSQTSWMAWAMWVTAIVVVTGCGSASARPNEQAAGPTRAAAMSAGGVGFAGDAIDAEGDEMLADADPGDGGGEPPPVQSTPPIPKAKPKAPPNATDAKSTKAIAPLLIYTANYTMAVFEVVQSIDAVQALAKKLGGYLVRRNDRSITVRVPAEKYTEALGDISKLGDVLNREETVEDVTEKFFDMKTRLDNARAMRVRLQELLAAAKDVKDALAVEKELARVTDTIERLEGKLKRLRELINFSTITVTFSPHHSENVNGKVNLPFSWLNELGLGPLLQLR